MFLLRNVAFRASLFLLLVTVVTLPSTAHAWTASNATYDSVSFSFGTQETSSRGFTLSADGSKMYVVGYANDTVYQYTLSTAYDLSTASYASKSFSVASQSATPFDVVFSTDGTKMYVVHWSSNVYQYTLGTAWDVSTASYASKSYGVNIGGNVRSIAFKSDGTKLYVADAATGRVYQHSLSSGWDLATASSDGVSFVISSYESGVWGLTFKTDGTEMYTVGDSGRVKQYTLSTPWSVTSASYTGTSGSLTSQDSSPSDVEFSSSGDKMYMLGFSNDRVYQYSLADTTNPTVSSLSPTDGATTVSTTANLVITFTEAVDVETGNIVIYKTSDNSTVETIDVTSGLVTGTGTNTITINPSTTLSESTGYYVQIAATVFDDAAGNSYAGITNTTSWNFTTADTTNPTVLTLSPADNSTGVSAASSFVITFSEAVDVKTGNITIYRSLDNSQLRIIDVTTGFVTGTGTNVITVTSNNLSESVSYYVQIDASAFDDTAGNSYAGISDTSSWNFDTISTGGIAYTVQKPPVPVINVESRGSYEGFFSLDYTSGRIETNEVGFEYWSTKDDKKVVIIGKNAQGHRQILKELSCETEYSVRAYAKNSADVTYSEVKDFETGECAVATVEVSERTIEEESESDEEVASLPMALPTNSLPVRDLALGMVGEDVKNLQKILIAKDGAESADLARLGATGFFGRYTENALRAYQASGGISPHSGYFGPLTRTKMKESNTEGLWW